MTNCGMLNLMHGNQSCTMMVCPSATAAHRPSAFFLLRFCLDFIDVNYAAVNSSLLQIEFPEELGESPDICCLSNLGTPQLICAYLIRLNNGDMWNFFNT